MRLDSTLSADAHRAIVECLRIAARRGRQLRLEREQAEKETTQKERAADGQIGGNGHDGAARLPTPDDIVGEGSVSVNSEIAPKDPAQGESQCQQ